MKTKIIKISDDQNEITHESGVVTVAVKGIDVCIDCVYFKNGECLQFAKIDCARYERNDNENVIFKLKQP